MFKKSFSVLSKILFHTLTFQKYFFMKIQSIKNAKSQVQIHTRPHLGCPNHLQTKFNLYNSIHQSHILSVKTQWLTLQNNFSSKIPYFLLAKPVPNQVNHVVSGIGTFESRTGIYIGSWKSGLQEGNGTAIYNNGNRYDGKEFFLQGNNVLLFRCTNLYLYIQVNFTTDSNMAMENSPSLPTMMSILEPSIVELGMARQVSNLIFPQ